MEDMAQELFFQLLFCCLYYATYPPSIVPSWVFVFTYPVLLFCLYEDDDSMIQKDEASFPCQPLIAVVIISWNTAGALPRLNGIILNQKSTRWVQVFFAAKNWPCVNLTHSFQSVKMAKEACRTFCAQVPRMTDDDHGQ
ncbi:hypothetical protein T10_11230 [Trichinella papuae]|uniref:Uncharacterized protein n=1 Tax=Trichinella papuae TaxID=268474 RepID=A0A0V1M493_9BILA|nr:hypothetical protein T10_11230 [Trichinella papuae]